MKQSGSNTELSQIIDRACVALSRAPSERLWEAAQRCDVPVVVVDQKRSTLQSKPFKQVFAGTEELGRAVAARSDTVRGAALALLADLDKEAATAVLGDVLRQDLSDYDGSSYELALYRSIGYVYADLAPRIPPRALGEIWLAGRLPMREIKPEVLRVVPLAAIGQACRARADLDLDVARLLREHDGLANGEGVLTLLSSLVGARSPLIYALVKRLGQLAYAPAASVLFELALRAPPTVLVAAAAAEALLKIGDRKAIEALAALLDDRAFMPDGTLDPRLVPAVEAALRCRPSESFTLFEKHVSAGSLDTPRGLAVARQALLADAKLLAPDPRWIDFAARHLNDDRLPARAMLSGVPPEHLREALAKVGYRAPVRAHRTHPIPASPRWLERYQAGEHEAVWDEIRALEDSAQSSRLP